ncbi:MAG: ribosome small subunit-dependent GTPase A [Oscillospiraceae bacterium]|nr:ribosome small subunit-dependent GTPase A [Oscillospiraceae bacterium]
MKCIDGIILKGIGGFYYVEAANTIYECKARGIFRKKNNSPLAGDNVRISIPSEGFPAIEEIYPRRNSLRRPPLANIDTLVIVCSTVDPTPNTIVIDKMTAAAVDNDIEPVIVISKSDLKSGTELADIYRKSGFRVFEYSSNDINSALEIRPIFKDKITAFAGNSGVGKSTLLNTLYPQLSLDTGEISEKLGRGRHTTRTVELYKLDGGYIADTPGFSTVDIERFNMIEKDNIQYCFPEFKDYLTKCKFTSCSHTCEKGCCIIDAVNRGEIPESRHKSYVAMYNEVKDIKKWQLKNQADV